MNRVSSSIVAGACLALTVVGVLSFGTADASARGAHRSLGSHSTSAKYNSNRDTSGGMSRDDAGDIIDVAVGPGMQTVTTLVAAVQAADLVEALKGDGPFTVFAPTNDAFAKLPKGTVETLLKPENKKKLQSILLYHVHAGEAIGSDKLRNGKLSTLNGKPVRIRIDGPTVTVGKATITKTDVMATNGVIHWIDTVILP